MIIRLVRGSRYLEEAAWPLGLDEHVDGVVGAGLLEECRDGDPPDLRPYEHTEKSVGRREGGRDREGMRLMKI